MNPENPPSDPRNHTTLCCDACGEPPFAVAPGTEDIHQADLFVLARGVRARCWCFACWQKQFAEQTP